MAEAIHVDVHDGCREHSQHLRDQEAADDRIAERLTDFRADPGAEHQRDAGEQRAHRRHQDWAKAQTAGLVDRLLGAEAALALADQGKVDQHDAVLFDDADQQDDPDDADHVQGHAEQHKG